EIAAANRDPAVHAITVLAPLPADVDVAEVMEWVDPNKDVEGLHPYNAGRLANGKPTFVPFTAEAILLLLRENGVRLEGARAVVHHARAGRGRLAYDDAAATERRGRRGASRLAPSDRRASSARASSRAARRSASAPRISSTAASTSPAR